MSDRGQWCTLIDRDGADHGDVFLPDVPRFGEVVQKGNSVFQVEQVMWVSGYTTARVIVSLHGEARPSSAKWSTDIEAAKDGKTKLLTIEINGERHATTGGWDSDWTGQCWVYHNRKVPPGTVPLAWMPMPEAMA